MKLQVFLIFVILVMSQAIAGDACKTTYTTASGTKAPRTFCSGDLIFEDNFDGLDQSKWKHEVSMYGGGNWEFQWYVNDRRNSFTQNGVLHLRPTYTSDVFGHDFIYHGRAVIPANECTNGDAWGCDRTAGGDAIINPIRSAKVTTSDSFSFKYGILEIRARNPAGDWIWPALWMMPKKSVYGGWPRSGEIDLMETRGNRNLLVNGVHVGDQQVGSTLHFGPAWNQNAWGTAHATRNRFPPYDEDYHVYKLVWTPWDLQFYIDGNLLTNIQANDGFWKRGGFSGQNIWAHNPMAPFDQEFYIILNNAVGGTNFFSDSFVNGPQRKPWRNDSPRAMKEFWEGRWQWEPTWNFFNDDRDLKIDSVRVWAL